MYRHLALIALLGAVYELQFLYEPVNPVDEGWPLYAASRLIEGGVLYDDTFFVFPPGHLLSAWVARSIDPPGFVAARCIYGFFNVAVALSLYLLGRRLMAPHLALLAALMVVFAGPSVHSLHNLFGFRYLVWAILALLAFGRHLDSDERCWLFVAGAAAGVAVAFRLTPGFAALASIGLGCLVSRRAALGRLADLAAFAVGFAVVILPVLAWATSGVELATIWREVVVRPVVMTERQSLPVPWLGAKGPGAASFVALQFWFYPALLVGYGVGLTHAAVRAWRGRGVSPDPLRIAVWAFAAVYFARSLGRADVSHLLSALPPLCLLSVDAASRLFPWLASPRRGHLAAFAILVLWVAAWGSAGSFVPMARDLLPLPASDARRWSDQRTALQATEREARAVLDSGVEPRILLDLSARPSLYLLGTFVGPGYADVVMPGTFMDAQEEARFLSRLREAPPEGVFWPSRPFDGQPQRDVSKTAPAVTAWARGFYSPESAD
jgi:hypothetical protein